MAVIVLIFSWGLSVQAQLLPTSESKIRLNKNKTIRLNETEVTSNRDWAFMWHWLNAPSHHEYKEEMIKKFKHYTYQDGTETKFKRPFIEELDKNKQPEKSDHFITRDLLHIDKLAPFFTASQKLYCKDPDNVSEDYCKEGANRREIWEEKTQAHLLETDIDELGTQGLFRRANHALVMHKYLACEEEKAGVEITNLKLLEDQLRNIGNYINQQKEYADKSMENKRLRTLVRIGKVVDLDELPLPHERNPAVKPDTSPNAKSDISSKPGDGELPPIPGNHKQTSSKNESDTATPKEEITSHSKKEKTGATTSNKEVQKTDKDLEKTPSIKTDAKTIAAKKAEVKPATKSDSDKPAFTAPPENEHKLAEFIERLSKMTWAERRRNFQEEPANLYNYYNTLSDEARDNLIYEETQFYFEKFLPIKQVFLKANSHLPPEESKKHLEILAAILTPTQPKNWPTVGSFKEPSPSVIKGLTEWVDQTVNKFKSDPGLKSSGDFITAGTELKKRSASLKKAIQDFKSVQRSNPRDLKTKRILRDEFHQLKTIREDVENLLKAKGKSDPIK